MSKKVGTQRHKNGLHSCVKYDGFHHELVHWALRILRHFRAVEFSLLPSRLHAHPSASKANRYGIKMKILYKVDATYTTPHPF